jgi:hypothetical protein
LNIRSEQPVIAVQGVAKPGQFLRQSVSRVAAVVQVDLDLAAPA